MSIRHHLSDPHEVRHARVADCRRIGSPQRVRVNRVCHSISSLILSHSRFSKSKRQLPGVVRVGFEKLRHPGLQDRNEFRFEPGISPEPQIISRAGMRQRNALRPVYPPRPNRLGDRAICTWQVIGLRILPDDQCELNMLQMRATARTGRAPRRASAAPRR